MPQTAKSDPECDSTRLNGDGPGPHLVLFPRVMLMLSLLFSAPAVGSKNRKMLSGFLKMSLGPRNPRIARFMDITAASVEIAADEPLESESCFPARMARKGT